MKYPETKCPNCKAVSWFELYEEELWECGLCGGTYSTWYLNEGQYESDD